MGIKVYKPISNARRQMSIIDNSDLTKKKPEKSLLLAKKKSGGRNSTGRITVRHIGGGSKQFYRIIDFKRDKFDIPAKVTSIEYDPNRSARIALLTYRDGEKRYIIAPVDLKVNDVIISSKEKVDIQSGNATALENIPIGSLICNIELFPGKGGEMARSAGAWAKLMSITEKHAQLKLPSSEIRLVPKECMATIGQISNPEHMHVKLGKAGRKRHMGIKPTVRGKVMNPVDHPHGGGEARNPIGLKYPKTPWGKHALGVLTRKKNRPSDRLIIKRRKNKRKKK
ncbi:50S ribosomal protein L2 [Patescibacteria group bacterium]|nr:50S ribosomal protein L2 [Patescibacteria group bacterium]